MQLRFKLWIAILLMSSFILFYQGCSQLPKFMTIQNKSISAQHNSNKELAPGNWDTFNYSEIKKMIHQYGHQSQNYKKNQPPYAVFDFDNTSVFLDIEEAIFIYQLEHLMFKVTPERLNQIIKLNVDRSNFKAKYNNQAHQPVNIDVIAADIEQSYRWLYFNYQGLNGHLTLSQIQKNAHYANFKTKMRYLYEAISGSFQHEIAYRWITYLFEGLEATEVRAMARDGYFWQLRQPIEQVTWTSPQQLAGQAGIVSVSWQNGLRPFTEMKDLYGVLQQNGFQVYICSASFSEVIKEMMVNPQIGFNVPEDHVYAVELQTNQQNKIIAHNKHDYPFSFGVGKSQIIQNVLVKKYAYGPVFVAGDSRGDVNMMQDFKDTQKVLIINRLSKTDHDIQALSTLAQQQYKQQPNKYLLQGRDANTGQFVKSMHSVALKE